MKKAFFLSVFLTLSSMMQVQAVGENSLLGSMYEPKIIVNNRILAKVNGKAISVVDLTKKMDMLFTSNFHNTLAQLPHAFNFIK